MKLAWIAIIVLAGGLASERGLAAQRELPVATVHVDVIGPFGAPIRGAKVRLLTPDRKRDLSDPGGGPTLSNVPYGQYIIVASDRGGGLAEREVVVNAKELWVRVGLAFPTGNRAWPGGDLTVSGDLIPHPANSKDWWVRVEGVFLHAGRESPILGSGRFSIDGLEMGAYLVEVFEGAKIRHVETIEIDANQPIKQLKISLPERPRR